MSKWDFFELNQNKEVVPLSDTGPASITALSRVLRMAAGSTVPDPKFSNYYVRCACLVMYKGLGSQVISLLADVPGGNIEYGLCGALHGEESLVAVLKSELNKLGIVLDKERHDVFIAFSSESETGRVPTCCGNCRDIMRDALPPDTRIFAGNPDGGKVTIARLSDLLIDDFGPSSPPLPQSWATSLEERTIYKGMSMQNDIYFPGKPNSRRRYYASIVGYGQVFYGAHDVMCDYHPIYAIRDAVRQARRENRPHFGSVNVICLDDGSGLPPDVMYKDRQHLLELNFQQECLLGHEVDPPVYLMTFECPGGGDPEIKGFWQTSVKNWLPYPFSPAAFGDEFVAYATKEFKKK